MQDYGNPRHKGGPLPPRTPMDIAVKSCKGCQNLLANCQDGTTGAAKATTPWPTGRRPPAKPPPSYDGPRNNWARQARSVVQGPRRAAARSGGRREWYTI